MTLLPQKVWLGAPVDRRYELIDKKVQKTIIEATTAAMLSGRFDLALEWLEQGRCFIWSQLLQLRTPLDKLQSLYPQLAEELKLISHNLDVTSISRLGQQRLTDTAQTLHESAQVYRRLAEKREELIESIQQLSGFEDFLRPPNVSHLLGQIQGEIIVVLIWNNLRCVALIARASTPSIKHIHLRRVNPADMEKAKLNLRSCLRTRFSRTPVWLEEEQSKVWFQDLLRMLWYDVAQPILDHLGITQVLPVDDLPRIIWCLTGPFSFLPIHAAGDYRSPSTILSNLAVSSYIPNLGSINISKTISSTFSGILAIGIASPIRGSAALPGTKVELDRIEQQFTGLSLTRLEEEEATADEVLRAMANHSWVHFACHASQSPTDPLKSAFQLYDKDLDLATICQTSMKNAGLAFLSACQTATGDSALPDEVVHLAAGLLMAGYPSIIATMWSINDSDAPLVAGKVYECMLEGGSPDGRKAAIALHNASIHLRNTIGIENFERWVPFIHIGC
ncbi:hypothetical protein FRC12_014335 [Ceratobasidium sp. 428]|nr:hypothetical protein FRC12_014335 [Ceratobasidium sp. 428]